MGRDKALLPWPPNDRFGSTFLSAAIRLLNAQTDLVIVVAGANTRQLEPVIYAEGAFLVENPEPDLGQFSSLRVGLQDVLSRGRDGAVVTLVDRPPVRPATLQALLLAFESAIDKSDAQWKWAVIPEFGGQHGHPIVVGREMIEAFLRAPAGATARDIVHARQDFVGYVPVGDRFVTKNVDTPEEYAALAASEPA